MSPFFGFIFSSIGGSLQIIRASLSISFLGAVSRVLCFLRLRVQTCVMEGNPVCSDASLARDLSVIQHPRADLFLAAMPAARGRRKRGRAAQSRTSA